MKRVLLNDAGSLSLEVDDESEPGQDEVVVEVAACGICGSDLHAFHGEHPLVVYPVTPGHEFSGTITAVGEGGNASLAGARRGCVSSPRSSAGGVPNACPAGTTSASAAI